MEQRGTQFALLLLLVAVGFYAGRAQGPARPPSLPSAAESKPKKEKDRLTKAVRDFLGSVAQHEQKPQRRLGCLVATVPDWVDSQYRWMFDANVSAIQQAAGAAGFVLDRYSVPDWRQAIRRAGDSKNPPPEEHHVQPGLIIFREAASELNGLAVLLVAESPATGIHKEAFRQAVDFAKHCKSKPLATLRVLGPNFSGSAHSLAVALKAVDNRIQNIQVISGGASAFSNVEILTSADSRVTFDSTVLPDSAVMSEFMRILHSKGLDKGRIGLLVEGTSYAISLAEDLAGGQREPPVVVTFPVHISQLRSDHLRQTGRPEPPGQRLSSIGLESGQLPMDRIPSLTPHVTNSQVEMLLKNLIDGLRRERVSTVGILATDTRDKLFLARELTRRMPNVVKFTTEADLLYAHPDFSAYMRGMLVASTYPLFPFKPFESHRESSRLEGPSSLLLPTNNSQGIYNAFLALVCQEDSGCSREFIDYYEDESAEESTETGSEPKGANSYPALWISLVGRHGLWPLHVIERSQFARPEARRKIQDYVYATELGPRRPAGAHPHPSPAVLIVAALSALWCFVFWKGYLTFKGFKLVNEKIRRSYSVFRAQPQEEASKTTASEREASEISLRRPRWPILVWYQEPQEIQPGELDDKDREMYEGVGTELLRFQLIFTGLQACLLILVGSLTWLWLYVGWISRDFHWTPALFTLLFAILLYSMMSEIFVYSIRLMQRGRRSFAYEDSRRWWFFLVLLAGLIVLGLCFHGFPFLVFEPQHINSLVLLLERATNPQSWLSPVTPLFLILLSLCLWCGMHLSRISWPAWSMKAHHVERLSELGRGSASKAVRSLRKWMESPTSALSLNYLLLVVFLLVVPELFLSPKFYSGENLFFALLMKALGLLAQALILVGVFQALDLWKRLRRILRQLARQPIAEGFDEVKGIMSDPLKPRYPRAIDLAPCVDLVSGLFKRMAPSMKEEFENRAEAIKQSYLEEELLRRWHISHTWQSILEFVSQIIRTEVRGARGTERLERPEAIGDKAEKEWFKDARHLTAIVLALSVRAVLSVLLRCLGFLLAAQLLLFASHLFYPFMSRHLQSGLDAFYLAIIAAVAVTIFVQANRDDLLCRIAGTDSGKITWSWEFFRKLAVFGVIPLLGLFAAYFPELSSSLFAWVSAFITPSL